MQQRLRLRVASPLWDRKQLVLADSKDTNSIKFTHLSRSSERRGSCKQVA
jgi:hypothetical protein